MEAFRFSFFRSRNQSPVRFVVLFPIFTHAPIHTLTYSHTTAHTHTDTHVRSQSHTHSQHINTHTSHTLTHTHKDTLHTHTHTHTHTITPTHITRLSSEIKGNLHTRRVIENGWKKNVNIKIPCSHRTIQRLKSCKFYWIFVCRTAIFFRSEQCNFGNYFFVLPTKRATCPLAFLHFFFHSRHTGQNAREAAS